MTLLRFFIAACFVPFQVLGQSNRPAPAQPDTVSVKEIYSVIKAVIKAEHLQKTSGLSLQPSNDCNNNKSDEEYLPELLIKPETADSSVIQDSLGFTFISHLEYPDKNLFYQEDIDYMLRSKTAFTQFTWDNKLLGFNLRNKKEYYRLSIPLFNKARTKAVLKLEYLCQGLCGGGRTLLMTKTKNGWTSSFLEMWLY